MVIILFVVTALFGIVALALWAALASARSRLQRADVWTAELLDRLTSARPLDVAELQTIAARRIQIFQD